METALRGIAIFIEVSILTAIIGAMMAGIGLVAFDIGLGAKYKKIVTMALIMVTVMCAAFFIGHLTFLYPTP